MQNGLDKLYKSLVSNILEYGYNHYDPSREMNTRAIQHVHFNHDMENGFPLLTTKKVYWKGVVGELLWFLKGDTNIKYLVDNKIHIWDKDAYNYYKRMFKESENKLLSLEEFIEDIKRGELETSVQGYRLGDLGPVYGKQWRDFGGKDQLVSTIMGLLNNPLSRRHVVSAWNPSQISEMALPPCHLMFMFNVTTTLDAQYLDLSFIMRSNDVFLGLPFNISSYALLLKLVASIVGMEEGYVTGFVNNAHLYENHLKPSEELLEREPFPNLPTISYSDRLQKDLDLFKENKLDLISLLNGLKISDFVLNNYESHGIIKAEMIAPKK